MKLTARHLIRGRGFHRRPRVAPRPPLRPLLRPEEALDNRFAYCPAEERHTLHALLRIGARICWTCRTRTEGHS